MRLPQIIQIIYVIKSFKGVFPFVKIRKKALKYRIVIFTRTLESFKDRFTTKDIYKAKACGEKQNES